VEGSGYGVLAILLVTVLALIVAILALTHAIGPKRHGAVKDLPYESGVDPVGDARRRFNVRFYLVAVLFLVFDVEILFLYPWAVLFPRTRVSEGSEYADWAVQLANAGYGPGFLGLTIGFFFALLLAGFVYEWRKGVFRWD
jgi:NADH-quinone oxidoreductase subunit A